MLIIGMSLAVKVLSAVAIQHRSAEQRQRATQEAANLMERIMSYRFEEVTSELVHSLSISQATLRSIPSAELAIEVNPSEPGPGRHAKGIRVQLRWRNRAGEWEAPVRLTTWIEQRRSGQL